MIDTDKYEGHKTAPWRWWSGRLLADADNYGLPLFQLNGEPNELDTPDVHLIADAPLLLEEVKRLRGVIAQVWDLMQNSNYEEREMFFWGFDKKNTGWLKAHEELAMKELNWGEEE